MTSNRSKMTNRRSMRMKLIAGAIILLIIPMIILGTFSYQTSERSLDELGETNLKNSVKMTIEMIEQQNEAVKSGAITLEEAQEQVKVAVLGERQSDGTRPINKDLDLGENGYIFIQDQEGTLVAHPNIEGESLWDEQDETGLMFGQEMIRVGNDGGGTVIYSWPFPSDPDRIERKVTYSETDPYWNWNINASTYMIDFNQPANHILKINIIVMISTIVIGLIIVWIFIGRLTRPMRLVTDRMNQLAAGDLTGKPIQVRTRDETGQLAFAMNEMQERLKEMITRMAEASNVLTGQSEEFIQSANEVRQGAEQVASTVQEIATGAEQQANHASELSESMQNFAIEIEVANKEGENVQRASGNVLQITDEGTELMNTSKNQMTKIDEIVQDAVAKVKGLDTQSQTISKLIGVIQEIAEQTNLLALNAAIESARAGEHGRGFAVVADEVRQLAEQVSESVTDITNIVENIQSESSIVANSLEQGYKDVEEGTKQIETTNEKFAAITEAVDEMATSIQSVTTSIERVTAQSEQMNLAIENIAAISEQSAAGIEETSASTEETSSAMDEVANSANDLAKLAENLNDIISQFKV